ncbi:MAG: hypothetical protein RLZZ350_2144 [Verrucomicrobiota bacterium]|jgi:PAS domain S-box-containing protein
MHRLLTRQLRRHFGADFTPPPEWREFITAVDQAYEQSDADRVMLERSLEISSQELIESHRAEKESLLKEELRLIDAERQRFKVLADTVPAGVLRLDARQQCEFVNREWLKLTCMSAADCVGEGWWESVHPLDRKMFRELYDALVQQGTPLACEFRIQTRAARDLWVYCTAVAEAKHEGQESGWIFCIVDCTERKNTLKQIERSQRLQAIGVLAGGISHDLNNALAPILAGLDLFSDQLTPDDRKILDLIGMSARRSADMVRNLLTFARGVEGEKKSVDLHAVVGELEKVVRATFPKSIEIIIQLEDSLPGIIGNFTQVHQVLLNLAVNARDAMPDGGTLSLTARVMSVDNSYKSNLNTLSPGEYVMLTVADTGVGMTPEVQDRIFEPFFTTKDSDKGTGLGLSTVVGIINDHQGDIRVYSFVGRGTAFHVYLPVQTLAEPAITKAHAHENLDGHQRLVLLVDDEANIRTVCGAALRKHNFKIVEANNGTEALLKITELKHEIACVVTDIHMPNLDGVGFIRIVKRMLPGLPIVAMSGRLEGAELEQLRAQKISAIIEKPFPVKTLLAAMATMK